MPRNYPFGARKGMRRRVGVVGFLAVGAAAVSTQIESNIITITAEQAGAISISGGQYRKNGGAYTGSSGSVVAGDTVQLRVTSSASNSTAVTATATINGVGYPFVVTTVAAGPATMTLTGNSFSAGAAENTNIGVIGNVPAGQTPTFSPDDGRVKVVNDGGTWRLRVGASASVEGTINGTISATGANPLPATITVTTASSGALTLGYNQRYQMVGDSRTAQGGGGGGTYGTGTGLLRSLAASNGVSADSFLGDMLGQRLERAAEYSNAGGGGQNLEQIFAYPRTGTNTIDLDIIAARDIGWVILFAGTNNTGSPSSLDAGGTGRAAIEGAIRALTDPSYSWAPKGSPLNLNGGRAKTVIVINELPRGVTAGNEVLNGVPAPTAASLKGYADWLRTFDFNSGHANANPRVVVVDTFNDARMLDATSGGVYYPKPGLMADGLHPAPPGAWLAALIASERLNPLVASLPPLVSLPTTANLSGGGWLNPNPLFSGSGGVVSAGGATILNGGLVPAATRLVLSSCQGLTIDNVVTPLPDGRGNEYAIHITGTSTVANANITIDQLVAAGQRATIEMGTDILRCAMRARVSLSAGSIHRVAPTLAYQNASLANQVVGQGAGFGVGNAAGYANNAAHPTFLRNGYAAVGEDGVFACPPISLVGFATGNPSNVIPALSINIAPNVEVDAWIYVSQMGVKKTVA